MSTEKTKNLELHSWEPMDAFTREEFNENFDKIDTAVQSDRASIAAAQSAADAAQGAADRAQGAADRAQSAADAAQSAANTAQSDLGAKITQVREENCLVKLGGPAVVTGSPYYGRIIFDLSKEDMSKYAALLVLANVTSSNYVKLDTISVHTPVTGGGFIWLVNTGGGYIGVYCGIGYSNGERTDGGAGNTTVWKTAKTLELTSAYSATVYGVKA